MRVLLTNDDGFYSPGLQTLREAIIAQEAHEVWTIAPESEQSGMSHAITIHGLLPVQKVGEREFQISGSPADCVRIAILGLMAERPDLIISGINMGPNLGTDITYSGTVAAARQGTYMSVPSVAVSIFDRGEPFHFEALAQMVANNVQRFIELLDEDHFININGPNHTSGPVKTVITHPCRRVYNEALQRFDVPGEKQYWFIGGTVRDDGGEPMSDLDAVCKGHISISPICIHPARHSVDQRYEKAGFVE